MDQSHLFAFACAAATLTLAACAGRDMSTPAATATLAPTAGQTARGSVDLVEAPAGLRVKVHVTGLPPDSEHGFHVHEKGDCSAPDATSAGGHFNPTGQPHGTLAGPHHAGDMPSLKADAAGVADTTFIIDGMKLDSGTSGVIGRSVVVHAKRDDGVSQPAGDSGARVACGVIASTAMR